MHTLTRPTIFFLLVCLGLVACSKKQEVAPAQTPATSTAPKAAAPPPPPAPAPAPENFAGSWDGNSGENLPISFTVEGNQVTSLNASYAGRNGTCSFNGSIGNEGPAAISGKAFTSRGKTDRGPLEFTATGTFTSATEASGTLVWKGKSDLCGDINLEYKWTAKKSADSME